ncbi:MAG: response regulator [Acidobacteria bacterium]|nr:response regulator [Acidobacteriota bacterium]
MSSQQIKTFVSLRQFDQITQFDLVNDEQVVKAYQFTEDLQNLGAKLLTNAVAGIGTQAIVAERGMGKSHLLNLVRSIASVPKLVNLLEDLNAIAIFQKVALPKIPVDGFPTLTLGFDPEKGLNLVKAYPKVPGMENLPPANLIAYVDEIIEQKINTGVQIALFIDGISQFLIDQQQGEPLLQWLQELAKEAVNGKFSLMITLDQNVAEGPLKKTLASVFKYEYIPSNTIASIIDQKIFYKTSTQRRQIENLFWDLRKRMPHFSEASNKFIQHYPLHPIILNLVPAMRFYARSFSLFGFITAVSSRALLRRVFNLICADELFDSFEFDLRKHPNLTEAFGSYDYLFNYIPTLQQPHSLYAKMMLKGLLLFSLLGKFVTAKDLANSVMLYDEREPLAFAETLNSIMARLAATSSGLLVNADGPELSYKFYIPETNPIAMFSSNAKTSELSKALLDSQARTITKTVAKENPQTQVAKDIEEISPINEITIPPPPQVKLPIQQSGQSRFTTKENVELKEKNLEKDPLLQPQQPLISPVQNESTNKPSLPKRETSELPKPTTTRLFPTVPPPPILQQQTVMVSPSSSTPLPIPAKPISDTQSSSSTHLSLDKLTFAVSKISDDDIRLDQILISGGKKFFKDWPFTFEDNKFRDRVEINLKWRGSLRKGILKFGGETEIYKDLDSQAPPCDYDWQITVFRAYAPMVLPPPAEAPITLLHWQPISLSTSERLVLKQLLIVNEADLDLGDEKEVAIFKNQLEDQVSALFQKIYLKSRLLTNQHIDLTLPNEGTFLSNNLTKLLDKLFAKRYPKHPNFEDLLTLETVTDLLPWLFHSKTSPNLDQEAALEQFALPLNLVSFQENSSYKISSPEKNVPLDSPVGQFWQTIEQNQNITKLHAFKLVHKEPFGLQRPALLLILAALAGSGQIVLLDELNEPIHDSDGLRPDVELADFSSIRLLKGDIKQVSWKAVKKSIQDPEDLQDFTLLVVDDDATIHMVLKIAAQKLKCKIETATDGVTALEKLNNLSVDLLISDLRMPNMTGIELYQRIQNNPSLKGVPFVVLSSIDDDEEVAAALEQGVEDYWIKPLRVNEIQARIKRLLTRRYKDAVEIPNTKSNAKVVSNEIIKANKVIQTPITPIANNSAPDSLKTTHLDNQKLLDIFQQQAEKEITILPGKLDLDLIKSNILSSSSKANKPVSKESSELNFKENEKKPRLPNIEHPPIPHPPIPKQTDLQASISVVEKVEEKPSATKDKKPSKSLQRPSKSLERPSEDGLAIPTRTDEIPSLSQLPSFEIKTENKKPNQEVTSESSPIFFNVNLSNSEGMLMEIMQLYNHFWDTCRKVGNPKSIPEYQEFKELVIAKATKLKKQFHWDEVTFIIAIENEQAHIDCQINRTSNFLKTPPKFRVL